MYHVVILQLQANIATFSIDANMSIKTGRLETPSPSTMAEDTASWHGLGPSDRIGNAVAHRSGFSDLSLG